MIDEMAREVLSANSKISLLVVTRFCTANSNTSIYINAMVMWDNVRDSYFTNMSSASGSFAPHPTGGAPLDTAGDFHPLDSLVPHPLVDNF